MSIWGIIIVIGVFWTALAFGLGVLVGKGVKLADEKEGTR